MGKRPSFWETCEAVEDADEGTYVAATDADVGDADDNIIGALNFGDRPVIEPDLAGTEEHAR